MKKKIIYTLLLLLAFILYPSLAHAAVPTLEQIRDAYNANTTMTEYATLMQKEFIAATDTTMPNTLLVTIGNGQIGEEVDFTLANNILSNTNLEDSQMFAALFLADAIGKIYGYDYGKTLENILLFKEEYMSNVNLEEDGIEIRENDDGSYSFKIDISKKIQLQDLSNFYIKPSMIIGRDDDEDVSTNEMGNYKVLAYRIYYNDDNTEIYVGEDTKLTDRAYKSIQSIIEALFGEDEVEYFTSKYPEFKEGLHQFDGFEIETDVNPKAEDDQLFNGKKIVKLVIEDDEFEEAASQEELETVDHGEKTIVLDFTKNESFVVPFISTSKDSDAAFLIKYLLNPLYDESTPTVEDDTLYFNIENDKVIIGTKDKSVFKLTYNEKDESFAILPTKTDVDLTTLIGKNVSKAIEPNETEDKPQYGQYTITTKVIFGKETTQEETEPNPNTGDNILLYVTLFGLSIISLIGIKLYNKQNN